MQQIFDTVNDKMNKTINALIREYGAVRAGRANPAVLDRIQVEYYGSPTPINQVAAVSVPEPRTIMISPWDKTALKDIEKAILTSDLGLNPQNDGSTLRLNFPPLTEERRRELVKGISKTAEDSKVAIRSIRRDAMEKLKDLKKKSEITEDDLKNGEKKLQDIADKFCKEIDDIEAKKEKEILEI